MKVARLTFALLLVSLMAAPVLAQAQGGGGRRGGGGGGFMMGGGTASALDRTGQGREEAQQDTNSEKSKVNAVAKDYAAQFKALHDKSQAVLAKERQDRPCRSEEGYPRCCTGRSWRQFTKIRDVMNGLSQEQKDKQAAVAKEVQTLVTEVRGKIEPILTDAQKAHFQQLMNRRGGQGGKRGGKAPACDHLGKPQKL